MTYKTIQPAELAARLADDDGVRIIDVREEAEHEIAHIEGVELLPLSRFTEWAGTLRPEEELVIMCHHGIRSAQVCMILARADFTRLHNLAGGIDAWSKEVNEAVPRY